MKPKEFHKISSKSWKCKPHYVGLSICFSKKSKQTRNSNYVLSKAQRATRLKGKNSKKECEFHMDVWSCLVLNQTFVPFAQYRAGSNCPESKHKALLSTFVLLRILSIGDAREWLGDLLHTKQVLCQWAMAYLHAKLDKAIHTRAVSLRKKCKFRSTGRYWLGWC